MKKQLITVLMLLFVASVTFGQINSYKLEVGDKYEINQEVDITIDQEVMGSSMQTTQKVNTTDMLEVISANNNSYEFRYTSMSRKLVMNVPMAGEQVMDSEGTGPMDAAFKAMVNRTVIFTMDQYGQVLEFQGLDEAQESIKSELNGTPMAAQAGQLANAYSEEVLRAGIQSLMSFYSNEASKEWNKSFRTNMNQLPVQLEMKYWHDTDTSVLAEGTLVINGDVEQMGMAMKTDLTGLQNTIYDLSENGMPAKIQSKQEAEGTMTAQGMDIPMKLSTVSVVTFIKK